MCFYICFSQIYAKILRDFRKPQKEKNFSDENHLDFKDFFFFSDYNNYNNIIKYFLKNLLFLLLPFESDFRKMSIHCYFEQ